MKRVGLLLTAVIILAACGSSKSSVPQRVSQGSSSPIVSQAPTPTVTQAAPKDARSSAYLQGNASPPLAAGKPGVVDVIAVGAVTGPGPSGVSVPIVVRNNTGHPVYGIAAAVTARDALGKLVAAGSDQGFHPYLVRPGEVAIGFVYFEPGSKLSASDKLGFQITSKNSIAYLPGSRADLAVKEATLSGGSIVGILSNTSGGVVNGPIGVNAICFSRKGKPISSEGAYANPDTIQRSGTASFQIDLYGDACPVFLVGGSGYRPD